MKAQQIPCYMALARNAALFILLATAALPALHAQTPDLPTAMPVATQPAPVTEQASAGARVGDVTSTLLQAQADGRVAAPRLPMLGVTADAGWQRYLDSFKHPLPEFFENKVAKSSAN